MMFFLFFSPHINDSFSLNSASVQIGDFVTFAHNKLSPVVSLPLSVHVVYCMVLI